MFYVKLTAAFYVVFTWDFEPDWSSEVDPERQWDDSCVPGFS